MKFNLRILYGTGESVDVCASAPDLVAFESEFEMSVARLESEMRVTHLLWLAWTALKRQKLVVSEFDVWLESVESVEAGSEKK